MGFRNMKFDRKKILLDPAGETGSISVFSTIAGRAKALDPLLGFLPSEKSDAGKPKGVYVIAPSAGGPCKVGIADDVGFRLGGMQTGNWVTLHPLYHAAFFTPGVTGTPAEVLRAVSANAYTVEMAVHMCLEGHRVRGEWFSVSAAFAAAAIEDIAKSAGLAKMTRAVVKAAVSSDDLRRSILGGMDRNHNAVKAGLDAIGE